MSNFLAKWGERILKWIGRNEQKIVYLFLIIVVIMIEVGDNRKWIKKHPAVTKSFFLLAAFEFWLIYLANWDTWRLFKWHLFGAVIGSHVVLIGLILFFAYHHLNELKEEFKTIELVTVAALTLTTVSNLSIFLYREVSEARKLKKLQDYRKDHRKLPKEEISAKESAKKA